MDITGGYVVTEVSWVCWWFSCFQIFGQSLLLFCFGQRRYWWYLVAKISLVCWSCFSFSCLNISLGYHVYSDRASSAICLSSFCAICLFSFPNSFPVANSYVLFVSLVSVYIYLLQMNDEQVQPSHIE